MWVYFDFSEFSLYPTPRKMHASCWNVGCVGVCVCSSVCARDGRMERGAAIHGGGGLCTLVTEHEIVMPDLPEAVAAPFAPFTRS